MKKSGCLIIGLVVLGFAVGPVLAESTNSDASAIEAARTGKIGDGKIFVLDLAECVRIRTGERGNGAIG